VRKEIPSTAELDFDQFCEYVLPYRVGHEQVENWRLNLYTKYQHLRNSFKNDPLRLARGIYKDTDKSLVSNLTISSYPFDIPASKMQLAHCGNCKNISNYTVMALRANGIPSTIDYVTSMGNKGTSHEWVSVLIDGRFLPLEAKNQYNMSKVFRTTYSTQYKTNSDKDIHPILLDPYRIDVTDEYVKTFDIDIHLRPRTNKKHAMICTYGNNKWVPQDFGIIKNSQVRFKKIGADVLYLAMYYEDGRLIPASNPFVLQKDGGIKEITSDLSRLQTVRLSRKFPWFPTRLALVDKIRGSRFQGANHEDFSDSVNLYKVNHTPLKIETIEINDMKKYRYIRYISNSTFGAKLAEMDVFSDFGENRKKLSGKIIGYPEKSAGKPYSYFYSYEKAFDGNYETFFETFSNNVGWTGYDLGKPTQISRIRYAPKSDTNFIIPNDIYALYHWYNNQWLEIAKKVGSGEFLEIKGVPANGLYILKDLSRGKEERIFTYENGKQLWW